MNIPSKLLCKYVCGDWAERQSHWELLEKVLPFAPTESEREERPTVILFFPIMLGNNAQATVDKWNHIEACRRG